MAPMINGLSLIVQLIKTMWIKIRKNSGMIITAFIFCGGMVCTLERRSLVFFFVAVLAVFAAVRIVTGCVTFSPIHVPLIILPLSYILASFSCGFTTFYSIGQSIMMCVPLLASLCLPNKRNIMPVIAIGACFLCMASILGLVVPLIQNTLTPSGFHSDSRIRLQTLLNYANTGAIVFGCGILALIGIQPKKFKKTKYIAITFLSICIILTGSRLGIAMTLAASAFYILYQRRAIKAILVIVCVVSIAITATIVIKPSLVLNSSLAMRAIYWSDALRAFARNPIFGLGPEGYIFKLHELQTAIYTVTLVHNAYLQTAIDAGLIALLALLSVSAMALKQSWTDSKSVFFILVLLLLHSSLDIDLNFFPSLMLLGLCISDSTLANKSKHYKKTQFAVFVMIVPTIIVSLYLVIGESIYANGLKFDRSGRIKEAAETYHYSLLWMPRDFRSSIRLAGDYILMHEQEKAIEYLSTIDCQNFNKASRSELLVVAYKNLGYYPEWNAESISLLMYAPYKNNSYKERAEYLLAAYYSMLITEGEYATEYKSLLNRIDEVNRSINGISRFLLEKDRLLRID